MGLFDGAVGTGGFASTAHVAELVRAPVVLVVDAPRRPAASERSSTASRASRTRIRVAGVILNNVGSDRHEAEAARWRSPRSGCPVLGVVPRLPDVVVPSRHLGLVPAAERRPEATAAVEALARMATEHVDLDAVLEVARRAPDLAVTPWDPATELGGHVAPRRRPRVGVAGGAAFSFGYTETSELLAAAGAEVVPFDPVHDARLPERLSGLVIGGGFPEVHAAELAANTGMRRSVAQLAADGGAIAAECAGLLYLGEELDGQPMCGVLPVTAAMGRGSPSATAPPSRSRTVSCPARASG